MRKLAVLVLACVTSVASAQDGAPEAATVAGWARTFLSGVTTLDAHFQQDSWVRVQRRTTTTHGRLRIARPEHVRLDYDESHHVGVARGADYVWIEPGDGTWPTQYTRGTNDVVSAALSVLVSGMALDRDFTVTTCASTSASAPAGTTCVELLPRARPAAFERMRMYVRTADDVRGRPARVAIEQHDGTWNTFTFDALELNTSIDEALFSLDPPAGARPTPASR
jgi:outer membrane lipoprotein-sorting protein